MFICNINKLNINKIIFPYKEILQSMCCLGGGLHSVPSVINNIFIFILFTVYSHNLKIVYWTFYAKNPLMVILMYALYIPVKNITVLKTHCRKTGNSNCKLLLDPCSHHKEGQCHVTFNYTDSKLFLFSNQNKNLDYTQVKVKH